MFAQIPQLPTNHRQQLPAMCLRGSEESRMKLISGGRRSGKTTKLIYWAAETGGYIVCHSQEEARRISRAAKELGLDIRFPISYGELGSGTKGMVPEIPLGVDNAEMLLQYLLGPAKVEIATITEDE